jgi:hypothetical protein
MIAYAKRALAYVLIAVLGLAGAWLLFGPQIEVIAAGVPLSEAGEPLTQAIDSESPILTSGERPCVQVGEQYWCVRSRAEAQASRDAAPVLRAESGAFSVRVGSRSTPALSGEAADDPGDEDDQGDDDDDQGDDRDDQGDDRDNDQDDDDDDRDDDDDEDDDSDDDSDDRSDDDRDDDSDDDDWDDDSDDDPDDDRDDGAKPERGEKQKCNQGVGNGPEGCDPGNSNHNRPSNDEEGGSPGNPGRRGGPKLKGPKVHPVKPEKNRSKKAGKGD